MVAKMMDRIYDYLNRFHLKGKDKEKTGEIALKIFYRAIP
jgi:hypothetical protein